MWYTLSFNYVNDEISYQNSSVCLERTPLKHSLGSWNKVSRQTSTPRNKTPQFLLIFSACREITHDGFLYFRRMAFGWLNPNFSTGDVGITQCSHSTVLTAPCCPWIIWKSKSEFPMKDATRVRIFLKLHEITKIYTFTILIHPCLSRMKYIVLCECKNLNFHCFADKFSWMTTMSKTANI